MSERSHQFRVHVTPAVITVLAVFLLSLAARAATVTAFSDLADRQQISTASNHEIKFVTPTGVDAPADTITLTLGPSQQPTFQVGAVSFDDIDFAVDTTGPIGDCIGPFTDKTLAAAPGASPTWGAIFVGQTLTLSAPTDAAAGEIDPGTCVRVRIGTNAVVGAAGNDQLVNPGNPNAYSLALGGTFTDTGLAWLHIVDSDQVQIVAVVGNGGGGGPGGGGPGGGGPSAPPMIFNVQATNITETSAEIRWDTDIASSSDVDYGTTIGYGNTASVGGNLFNHAVTLTGLTPGTLYHFQVRSTGIGTSQTTAGDYTFSTLDTTSPSISNVQAVDVTGTSARIVWDTNEDADSRVDYGVVAPNEGFAVSGALTNAHSLTLNGLQPNTLYRYLVTSKDGSNNSASSAVLTFTTLDAVAPVISDISVDNIESTSVRVNWSTNELADSRVEYGLTNAYGAVVSNAAFVANHQINLSSLTPNTLYHFIVISNDAAGNQAASVDQTFTTLPDAAPPANVINLTATPGDAQIALAWTNPGDADFAGVMIRRSTAGYPATPAAGTFVYDGSGTSHVDAGLTNGTSYYYAAFAYDASGNYASGALADGTPRDASVPSPVANFIVTPGDAQNALTWTDPNDPDFSVTVVRVSTTGYPATPTSGALAYQGAAGTFTHAGLVNGVTYYYSAFARDTSGNYSAAAQAQGTPNGPSPAATCGNAICEATETPASCPADCAVGPSCGNAICEASESHANCPADCPNVPTCGNAMCEAGETSASCPNDCTIGPACGNAICEATETPASCPADCRVVAPAPFDPSSVRYYAMGRTLPLHADAAGRLHALPNVSFSITVPAASVPRPVSQMTVEFGNGAYLLARTADDTTWYADLTTRTETGTMLGTLHIAYEDGQTDEVPFEVQVETYGLVYEKRGGQSIPLSGVQISVLREDGTWVLWSADAYLQANPSATDASGRVGYMVPPGVYAIEARKQGYRTLQTSATTIAHEVFNPHVELIAIPKSLADVIVPGAPLTENVANVAKNLGEQTQYIAKIFTSEIVGDPEVERAASQFVAPAAVLVTTAVLATAVQATSVLAYASLLFTQPLLLLGRKRRKEYGVVYNALSKLPIDLAIVRLYRRDGRLVRTLVTDKQGRYAFLVEQGDYRIEIQKPGFTFPSRYMQGRSEDTEYVDVYHGESIEVGEAGSVITANVPVDPVDATKSSRHVVLEEIGRKLQNVLAPASAVITFVVWIAYRKPYLLALCAAQIALYALFLRLARPKRPKNWGIVYDQATKKPIPFAVTRVIESEYNKVLESRVTDAKGRYNFLVGNNRYYVSVEKPGYENTKSTPIDLTQPKKDAGVIDVDIGMKPGSKK